MAVKRDENYITDKILVPHYNKSQLFRDFISGYFGNGFNFGDKLVACCDSRNAEYGNPDAMSSNGLNIIEVKISNNAKLQANEKKDGAYEKKLRDIPDAHLLYIVNDDFPMEEAVANGGDKKTNIGKRVRTIFWSEIYEFLQKLNSNDPDLIVIKDCIKGLEIESYDFHENIRDVMSHLNSIHPTKLCAIDYEWVDDTTIYSTDYCEVLENNEDVWIPLKINGAIRIAKSGIYLTCLEGRNSEDKYTESSKKLLESNKYKMYMKTDYNEYMVKVMSLDDFKDVSEASEKLSKAISNQEVIEEQLRK